MGFLSSIKAGLAKTRQNFTEKIDQLVHGYTKLDDEFLDDLEAVLISADVGIKTTNRLLEQLRKAVKEKEISSPDEVSAFLREEVRRMLAEGAGATQLASTPPTVIMVVGVNGVGKTTTIGKLARFYHQSGKKVLLAAGDTFRAAAIEQLEIWGERANADIIKQTAGSDPAAVAYDAVKAAVARGVDVLIIDTAGRLHTKSNLMEELKKIHRVIDRELPGAPHETLLVLDATTGQNAISQAKIFDNAAGLTGVALTKLDGTAKGGVILAVKSELGIPVKWVGVGEGPDDLRPFDPSEFANALFPGNLTDK